MLRSICGRLLGIVLLALLIVADGINCLLCLYAKSGQSYIANPIVFWSSFSEIRLEKTEEKRLGDLPALCEEVSKISSRRVEIFMLKRCNNNRV